MAYHIELYKQPNKLNFSKNPILFGFSINPFSDLNVTARHRIFVLLQFSESISNPLFEDLWTGTVGPDQNGYCVLDIATILDAKLQYFTPNPNIIKFFKCEKQTGCFRLRYYLADNNGILSNQFTSEIYNVYKGGVAKEDVDNSASYLNDVIFDSRTPLHYFHLDESVRLNQTRYLFFIYKVAASIPATQVLLYINYYQTDGVTQDYPAFMQNIELEEYQLYCVAVDVKAALVDTQSANFSLVKHYTIQIQDQNNEELIYDIGVNPLTFKIDHRPYYEEMFLLYRNSLGALDSIVLKGDKEFGTSIEGDKVDTVAISDMMGNVLINQEQFDPKNTINNLVKANTGWINKEELLRLRDLLLNKQVWSIYGKRLKPVYITTRNTLLFKQSDKLYSLAIDITNSYSDENTNPELLIDFGDICPAVDFIWGGCTQGGFMWVKWKLPTGYNRIEFSYTVDIFPAQTFVIGYTGNIGIANIDINSASNSSIVDFQVTIKARCICNDEVAPFSYGPYTGDLIIDGASLIPPIANEDVADESPRNLVQRLLKIGGVDLNVLDNDIAVNGGNISFDGVYESTGSIAIAASANGAIIQQSGAGGILYTPTPSSVGITTEDVIYYKCQEYISAYGQIQSNLSIIRVPLEGQIPPIFVKRTFLNHEEVQHNYGFLNQFKLFDKIADVYIQFFKDAACTIPVDVTGMGISVAYYLDQSETPYSSFGVAGTTSYSNSGTTVQSCTGTSMLLLSHFYYWEYSAAGGFKLTTRNPRSVLASSIGVTGYIGW